MPTTAENRLAQLIDEPELRDSALAQLCRDLIADQQRLHQRLERISRISDRYQADLRRSNEELATTNLRLSAALREVRTLGGFIPICSCCKKVRNDGGFWDEVETYLAEHSDAVFSQGRCPACADSAGQSRQPPLAARDGEDPIELARLKGILAQEEWNAHPLREEYARLSTDYQKLGRRLYKISRISDGFQTQMKEFNLALGRVSRTDALTGLANRRALLERLDQYGADAVEGPGFAVAMIDVDNFKRINDSFGHAAGDSVLRSLAALLAATVPDSGIVGRWGGEEFLLVIDAKHSADIAAVSEIVRAETEAMQIISGGHSIRVTVSIGIAAHERELSFEDTLRDADRALYAAKASGRNSVISLDEL